jgi:serine/threonine protein kinase
VPPELHRQVRQIFDEALDRSETERPAYVQEASGGDPVVMQAVERLLHAYHSSGSFLDGTAGRIEKLGRYVIGSELGRGAMGVVYDAIDPLIGRNVAVKVINLRVVTEPRQAQFLKERLFKEAKSAGQLFHRGIVVVLDVGQEGDLAYFTMERIDGQSLQQLLAAESKLPVREALDILRQVAAALDFAHERGVIHRDVKPANILIQKDNVVKVADFGIAKSVSTSFQTVTGLLMGTPGYMSPEQIESRAVDGRSDQFALAVLAYELLTGVKPFESDLISTLAHLIVYGERPSAFAANPELPAGVDAVLSRGLARLSETRFNTCAEFIGALESIFVPKPTPSPSRRTNRWLYQAAAVIVLVGVAAAGLLYKTSFVAAKAAAAIVNPPALQKVLPAPLIQTFQGNSLSIAVGKSTSLSWVVTGAKEITIDPGIGKVSATGSQSVTPETSTTYLLHAEGPGGAAHATVTVEVRLAAADRAHQLYEAAVVKRRSGRTGEALALLRQSAELGESSAMVDLGESYESGEGVAQDPAQALRWFRRAAAADNTSGMLFLGAMYMFGEGVPLNNAEAARWFQKATNKGNASAMYDLGTLYEDGKGVTKSTSIANQLYRRAAVLGNEEAKKRLARLASNK